MPAKVTAKLLHIPPHLSTGWDQVSGLRMEHIPGLGDCLVVALKDHTSAKVPGLDQRTIDLVFSKYSEYMESQAALMASDSAPFGKMMLSSNIGGLSDMLGDQMIGLPIQLGPDGIANLGAAMQHNPAQSGMPDLPEELLHKITAIAKAVGMEDAGNLPKAELHCNCFHCQLARAFSGELEKAEAAEEVVLDEDLRFRTWDIAQSGEQLYTVSHPLDPYERYTVFLGSPVGCTCGQKNCEHIAAVLNS